MSSSRKTLQPFFSRWVRTLTGRDYEVGDEEPLVDHVSGFVSAKTRAKQQAALMELAEAGLLAKDSELKV